MTKDKISNNDKDKNNKKTNIHEGHRNRLRKRINRNGLDSLEDHEVLEYFLFHVIPRKDCNPLAHALLNEFGNLHNVLKADESELLRVPEMTQIAAQFLSLFFKIYDRAMLSKSGEKIYLKTTQEIINYTAHNIAREPVEILFLIMLDINNKVIRCKKFTDDNHKEVKISFNQIIIQLAQTHADKFIIAHNHPSGGLEPSKADIDFYRVLKNSINLTNATLIDSVIVSNEQGISIKEYLSKNQLKIYTTKKRALYSSLFDDTEEDDYNYYDNINLSYQIEDDGVYELLEAENENLLMEEEENKEEISEDNDD